MNKNYFILGFVFLLFTSLVTSTTLEEGNVVYLSFDDADLSGSNPLDLTPNGNDGVNNGATTGVLGVLNQQFDYDGSTDYVSIPAFNSFSSDFTINFWITSSTNSGDDYVFQKGNSGAGGKWIGCYVPTGQTNINCFYDDGSTAYSVGDGAANGVIDGNPHMVTLVKSNNLITLYVDGSSSDTQATSNANLDGAYDFHIMNHGITPGREQAGKIDEFSVFNFSINTSQITYLYNGGSPGEEQQYPYVSVFDVNDSLEQTIFSGVQASNVTISTGTYATILTGQFNISRNNSPFYGTVVASTLTASSNVMTCRILIDGVEYDSAITRTNTANKIESMYLTTVNVTLDEGTHTGNFQCKKDSGAGSITVFNARPTGHVLVDNHNATINHEVNSISNTSLATLETIYAFNFTTNNVDLTGTDFKRQIVLDWNAVYDYSSTGNITTYLEIDNYLNCSNYTRYGASGTSGSVGGDCLIRDVGQNETINIKFNSIGSGTIDLNLHIKEFQMEDNEANITELKDINISSSTFTKIASINLSNDNHLLAQTFTKAGIPIYSTGANSDVEFIIQIIDGMTLNSSVFQYTATSQPSNLIIQDVFKNISSDDYQIELYARTKGDTVTIAGGAMISYLTNSVPVARNDIQIRAFDIFDNSSILNFGAQFTDGTTFTTTTGIINAVSSNDFENITVFTDLYFNQTIFNYSVFNISTLDVNLTLINSRIIINEKLRTQAGNTTIQNFVVEVFNQNNSFNQTFSTTNGNITLFVPRNENDSNYITYNLTFKPEGFEFASRLFNVSNQTSQIFEEELYFFGFNSINVNFFDTQSLNLLNGTNVSVQFIGATSFTNITDTGNLFANLLNPSQYTITFSAPNYQTGSHIFTLENGTTNAFNFYMERTNETSLLLITVKDKASKDPIQNSLITIQKYINNNWVTDQIVQTDFNGQAEAYFQVSDQFYNFLVEFQGTVFFGVVNSNENKKIIYTEDVTNGIVIEIDTTPDSTIQRYQTIYDIVTSIDYSPTTNSSGTYIYRFDNTDNLPVNATLEVYVNGQLNCTTNLVSESGILLCPISVDNSTLNTVTATGYIDSLVVESRQDILGNVEETNIEWSFKGFIIAVFLTLIFYWGSSKSPSVSLMVGTSVFVGLVVTRVVFPGTDVKLVLVMLFAAFILGRIPSKSGVNA